MPRKARIDAPGALHHVIIRGIERRKIFRSDYDRKNFLNRMPVLVSETITNCFAWAMLDNHVHLLLRSGTTPISLDAYPWCGHSVLMGKSQQPWQNIEYVYRLFSSRKREARKSYRRFVENGISEGKRPDLTGGGLLRSIGGWTGLKDFRKAGIRVKGDERILGNSDFVETVLASAKEGKGGRTKLSI